LVGEGVEVRASLAPPAGVEPRFSWSQVGRQPLVPIRTPSSPALRLRAPEATADYEIVLDLRVRAGERELRREVRVAVRADDDPPRAEVVAPQRAECGEQVALVGQAHNEPLQGVEVEWVQLGQGPRVALDASDRLQASFVAPEHDGPYRVELELRVRDGTHPPAAAACAVEVACDPAAAPLEPGVELTLSGAAGVVHPLPRGPWELSGALELADGAAPASAWLRFECADQAAALALEGTGGAELALSTRGWVRGPDGAWLEPEWSGGQPLGPWTAGVRLVFAFEFDGRELSVAFAPDGGREPGEPPLRWRLPIGRRPQSFGVVTGGAGARVGDLRLRGTGAR
jgi:hypothetical protein